MNVRESSVSPLAGKGKRSRNGPGGSRIPVSSGPETEHSYFPSNESDKSDATDRTGSAGGEDDDDDESDDPAAGSRDRDGGEKSSSPVLNSFKPSVSRSYAPLDKAPSPIFEKDVKAGRAVAKASRRLSSLAREFNQMTVSGDDRVDGHEEDVLDESMILPPQQARKSAGKKR